MYSYFILLILIVIMYCMIKVNNNLYLIMYSFVFSLITASLYFIYKAPDLALAEIAIGCGLTPLIYTIAISKQQTFVVVVFRGTGKSELKDENIEIQFEKLMGDFADHYGLKLEIHQYKANYRSSRKKSLKMGHIDLIAIYDSNSNMIEIEGNSHNLMINRLRYLLSNHDRINLKKEGEQHY